MDGRRVICQWNGKKITMHFVWVRSAVDEMRRPSVCQSNRTHQETNGVIIARENYGVVWRGHRRCKRMQIAVCIFDEAERRHSERNWSANSVRSIESSVWFRMEALLVERVAWQVPSGGGDDKRYGGTGGKFGSNITSNLFVTSEFNSWDPRLVCLIKINFDSWSIHFPSPSITATAS